MRRSALVLVALAPIFAIGGASVARGQGAAPNLDQVEAEVQALSQRVAALHTMYVDAPRAGAALQLGTRLADGRLMFLLRDYDRAAIVFLDLVESAHDRSSPAFQDARFYLAESLYLSRNLVAARGYFEEIADDSADRYRLDAAQRLLEIAFASREYHALDALYEQLERAGGGSIRPDIAYVRAKTLYFRGEVGSAIAEFGRIPRSSEYYIQAQYFLGTCYVRLEDWDSAVASFELVVGDAIASPNQQAPEIEQLARLALGRIHYELGQTAEALEAYQSVSRLSPEYDQALYEMCWTYIRDERYADALRTLEILVLAMPDSRFRPQAQLLRGDLLLRLSEFGEAQAIFDDTVGQFRPLADQLAELTAYDTPTETYFDSLVDPASGSFRLPDLAREWVEDDETMRWALALIEDLEVQVGEIQQSREIADEIEAVLSSSSRVDVFPDLRVGYGEALEIRHTLTVRQGRLTDLEARLLLPHADEAQRAAYTARESDRSRYEAELMRLPGTFEEMSDFEASVEGEIQSLETEVFRLGYEIQTQRAQLVAMRLMIEEEREAGLRSRADAEQLTAELGLFEGSLRQLERSRDALRRELEQARLQTGIGTVAAGGQDLLRRAHSDALDDEIRYLALLRGQAPDDVQRSVARIDGIRREIDTVEGEIDRFMAEIDRMVDQQTAVIVRQLDTERALLDEYESLLQRYGGQGERLAGEIAFANFVAVQQSFHDLVLQADVGIIDVAWREKEERTERIERLFDDRDRDLDVLDMEFREVLESD